MAILYVRSTDGNDGDSGATWALAKATLSGAFTAASAGDTIYVSHQHAGSVAAALTLTSPGTMANPCHVICVNDGAEPPTSLATTATITTESGGSARNISFAGFARYYGISFIAGTAGANVASIQWQAGGPESSNEYISCVFNLNNTGGTSQLATGNTSAAASTYVKMQNCTLLFGSTGQQIRSGECILLLQGCTIANTGTVPTTLITSGGGVPGRVIITATDLSAFGAGTNLLDISASNASLFQINRCKLGASVSLTTGSIVSPGGITAEIVNSDSSDTNYRYWLQTHSGTIEHETTIVRTGGASDGTTPISRELVANASCTRVFPLILSDLIVWNETTGSAVTLTVHTVTDNVTLTDQECWLEVEYLGTSGFPLSLLADDADSITDRLLGGSASNQTTSSETWTTTGLTTPVKQQLSVSVTPQEKGPIRCRVVLAKASTTVYVCPKVECSSVTEGRMYQAGASTYLIEPSAAGGTAAGSFMKTASGRAATY